MLHVARIFRQSSFASIQTRPPVVPKHRNKIMGDEYADFDREAEKKGFNKRAKSKKESSEEEEVKDKDDINYVFECLKFACPKVKAYRTIEQEKNDKVIKRNYVIGCWRLHHNFVNKYFKMLKYRNEAFNSLPLMFQPAARTDDTNQYPTTRFIPEDFEVVPQAFPTPHKHFPHEIPPKLTLKQLEVDEKQIRHFFRMRQKRRDKKYPPKKKQRQRPGHIHVFDVSPELTKNWEEEHLKPIREREKLEDKSRYVF